MSNPARRERFSPFGRPRQRAGRLLALWLLVMGGTAALSADGRQPLAVRLDNARSLHLRVELAADPASRRQGLMFRRHLPADAGMLFVYGRERPVQMWMKDTLIPLDMLFIDGDGRITRIVEHTTPQSTELIDSGGPVWAVLELNAGMVQRHGIRVGDRIRHPLFGTAAR